MAILREKDGRLVVTDNNEKLWIEPWGENALRVRSTKMPRMPEENWALEEPHSASAEIKIGGKDATVKNGKIVAKVTKAGKITFYNSKGKLLLEEFVRNRRDVTSPKCSALDIDAREHRPILGGDFSATMRFESDPKEKIFGMGQYQQPLLNLKGCELELAHRPLHPGHGGPEYVQGIYLLCTDCFYRPGQGFSFDYWPELLACLPAHLLRIVEKRMMEVRGKNHGGGKDRTCERASSGLVASGLKQSFVTETQQIQFSRHTPQI